MTTPAPTILVVEDNPATLKMLRLTLQSERYTVVEAPDGRTALARAERALPDLVLQDLILPDMDGFELVRRLRALAGGAGLPIVALTGFFSRLEEARPVEAGFTALLVKPIEPGRLLEAIRAYLPASAAAPATVGERRRLLVVDDDPVQLKLARRRLADLGFDVDTAGGAADAKRAARARRPDVILSDVLMPDVDGFQLCLELRKDPVFARVPIVLVSAQYGSRADQELARRVGANALTMRTPDLDEAVAAIVTALETGAPGRADELNDRLRLEHANRVIEQLQRQVADSTELAQRCALQAAQLSLLSGVAEALTRQADVDLVLRDVLAATLDAADISKAALFLRNESGWLYLRQDVGFSGSQRARLPDFFGHLPLLAGIVESGAAVSMPSAAIPAAVSQALCEGGVAAAHIVPLLAEGRGSGALVVAGRDSGVPGGDSIAFARALGNQLVQSMALARVVSRLAASEERYRMLLESATDAIAVLGPDGSIRQVNRRWEQILGRPREELVGRRLPDLAHRDDADAEDRTRDAAAATPAGPRPPLMFRGHDGAIVLMEFTETAVDVGRERVIMSIGRDVTEQRRLEEELRQAQKLEAIGQLAGGVAHDFNNLLTAMVGYATVLEDRHRHDARTREDIAQILKAGERASGLARQLLAFSRKEAPQTVTLDVNALAENIAAMLRRLMGGRVELTLKLDPGVGTVRADPGQLEQVMMNLAVNARDAMPHGGRLSMETANVDLAEGDAALRGSAMAGPGRFVVLVVSDTGVGMDDRTRRRIFEPFFTTKARDKGTGLGLSTVQRIVTHSGGHVSVESTPGRGTTFTIYLPRVEATCEDARPPVERAWPLEKGSETILLVEDEESVRLLSRELLERSGYRVLAADGPPAALSAMAGRVEPVDLLLTDVTMPGGSGPDLFLQLKALSPATRVLYMSGYVDDMLAGGDARMPGVGFLQKPFSAAGLARKVREVLDDIVGAGHPLQ